MGRWAVSQISRQGEGKISASGASPSQERPLQLGLPPHRSAEQDGSLPTSSSLFPVLIISLHQ
jgi:hypothetical protein